MQVRKGTQPCTSETLRVPLPKEWGQPLLQMKTGREVSQRGVPPLNTSEVSLQTRIKIIKTITEKKTVGGRNCSKEETDIRHHKEADSGIAQVLPELLLVLQGAWNICLTHHTPAHTYINTHPYKQR